MHLLDFDGAPNFCEWVSLHSTHMQQHFKSFKLALIQFLYIHTMMNEAMEYSQEQWPYLNIDFTTHHVSCTWLLYRSNTSYCCGSCTLKHVHYVWTRYENARNLRVDTRWPLGIHESSFAWIWARTVEILVRFSWDYYSRVIVLLVMSMFYSIMKVVYPTILFLILETLRIYLSTDHGTTTLVVPVQTIAIVSYNAVVAASCLLYY